MNNQSKEPLLLIHGIIGDGSFFINFEKELEGYCTVAYDRRGYGSDDKEYTDYSVRAQAEDAAKVLRESFSEPAWIFGNSAGSLIAIETALLYPELVRGLILLEPSFAFDEESLFELNEWNRELNSYVQEKKIKKALPAFSRVVGPSCSNTGSSLAEMKQTFKNLNTFMYGELNDIQHYRPDIEQLKGLDIPVTVVITEQGKDRLFGKTSVRGANIIGWRLFEAPGNHNTVKDTPKEFTAAFIELMKEMRDGER